jgi:hypothetical protein
MWQRGAISILLLHQSAAGNGLLAGQLTLPSKAAMEKPFPKITVGNRDSFPIVPVMAWNLIRFDTARRSHVIMREAERRPRRRFWRGSPSAA